MEGGAEVSPEAQRIAIAEACGWNPPPEEIGNQTHGGGRFMSSEEWRQAHIPDYLNDLNAMHEAEKISSDNNQMKFRGELIDMMIPKYGFESACLLAIHATAAQRAEAFLRTIGKWEEARK